MHVPIGYKFILGFAVVIAAVGFAPDLVNRLGYSAEMSTVLTYVVAMTIGLIIGWLFSRKFTRNISLLTESAESISKGDLTRNIEIRKSLGIHPGQKMTVKASGGVVSVIPEKVAKDKQ